MEDAKRVFDSMHPWDAISWNSMIGGCFSNGWHGTAVDFFSKMWSQGLDSVQSGIDDAALGSKLVFMYVKCGDMGSARRVLDAMSSKGNVHVWNLIMGGYAKGWLGGSWIYSKIGFQGRVCSLQCTDIILCKVQHDWRCSLGVRYNASSRYHFLELCD
uniref:Pentatricopeptide repeat-containing protein n=1 Tax=Zea mays TaxID=4577 RepID=A0A804ND37_MAIZE